MIGAMLPAKLSALKRTLLETLFPRDCGLCGIPANDAAICPPCLADLRRIDSPCPRCGSPLTASAEPGIPCGGCQREPPAFDRAAAPLAYVWPIDRVIKAYKFDGKMHLAPMLAAIAAPWLEEYGDQFDALVPVPLHRWRHARRGFNQAHELARELQRSRDLPILRCVVRRRRTRPQPGLKPEERRKNLRNAFRIRGRLRCRHPLIIDDVITTGATCNELASTLKAAGAETVTVLAIARTTPS